MLLLDFALAHSPVCVDCGTAASSYAGNWIAGDLLHSLLWAGWYAQGSVSLQVAAWMGQFVELKGRKPP
jgi:hypothetical protein